MSQKGVRGACLVITGPTCIEEITSGLDMMAVVMIYGFQLVVFLRHLQGCSVVSPASVIRSAGRQVDLVVHRSGD